MMVMPANHSSSIVHYWAGRHPGHIGWLIGPSAASKTKLRPWMPFALDNDAFSAFTAKRPWSEDAWFSMLDWVVSSGVTPLWMLIPDVVADRDATLRNWEKYSPFASLYGWPTAFAVQDGMTPGDLPDADILFVGGSIEWKWESLTTWLGTGRRVHVGRVNTRHRLLECEVLGVESIDGTGWMKATLAGKQGTDLKNWIESK